MPFVHQIGTVSVQKIVEMCGPGFKPDHLYPAWDPAELERIAA